MDLSDFRLWASTAADSVLGWTRNIIKLFVAFISSVILISIAVLATQWTIFAVGQWLPVDHTKLPERTLSVQQWSAARTAHGSVTMWVLQCVGAESALDLPSNLHSAFFDGFTSFIFSKGPEQKKPLKRELTVHELNAVQLSSSMMNQRSELGRKTYESYSYLQYIQWLTILIGIITTVVVSVSSTELFGKVDTSFGKGLRFLAIFLPALGTGVAAINAFYNPRDDWNKSANTLANVAQLHGQVAVGIWALECSDGPKENERLVAKLEEWTKRYNDIITISDSGPTSNKQEQRSGQPGALPPPQGGTGAQAPANPGGTSQ